VSEHAAHQHAHGHGAAHGDGDFDELFGRAAWEERYGGAERVWSGRPNPQLVAEAADLPAGTALDVGCGEGADAVWLAERGWRVTGLDIADAALRRAAAHAAERGADVAGRISWVRADLRAWQPGGQRWDLVSAQFMQLPPELRATVYARLAEAVAPGGTLLVVGHHPVHLEQGHGPARLDMFHTAEELAATLDPGRWEVVVAEDRTRRGSHPEHGGGMDFHDTVLRARRR
jgi:trans-aconitate methyltransferase